MTPYRHAAGTVNAESLQTRSFGILQHREVGAYTVFGRPATRHGESSNTLFLIVRRRRLQPRQKNCLVEVGHSVVRTALAKTGTVTVYMVKDKQGPSPL